MTDPARGPGALPRNVAEPAQARADPAPGVMTEYLTDDWGYFIRSARELERFRSPYQSVEVHDTLVFGKLFRLDGSFMTSEKDEFFYHENLVHMPALTHPSPSRALIVGGGDGGAAEELLKYPSMKSVTLCEIDLAVVDIARKHLQGVHRGALDDPRLDLRIGDGYQYIRENSEQFDLIILDLPDPVGPAVALYTVEFYRACAARLSPVGAMTLHIASPIAHPVRIRETLTALR
ncbi:MAG: polyamine aminopropyltransferase, partial [Propionivibrio sp.]